MDGISGLRGWQWLFLIEGLPAFILAFVALKLLPDGPDHASWLTANEKALIAEQLTTRDIEEKRDFWPALRDPRILALGLVLVGSQFGLYGVQLWLPQIVQGMGYSNFSTGFIVALPFVASMGVMILWGRSSDMRGERYWHIGLATLLAAAGLIVAGISSSNLLVLTGLTIALAGTLSVPGPLFSLPSTMLSGAAAAGAIALVNSMGTFGRFLGPTVVGVFREGSESYASGMFALAGGLVMSTVIIVMLGRLIAPRRQSQVSPQSVAMIKGRTAR
jgi:ACS family tartrate transporter-like MFS transporter